MRKFIRGLALMAAAGSCLGQKLPESTRLWSVGPLTKGEPVMGVTFGSGGATFSGPHVDTQTSSIFSATRSVAFAGDRIVVASQIGVRKVEGAQVMAEVYQLLSLDAKTGDVKATREFTAFGSLPLFATDDAHVIASGRVVLRLTPDLKDNGSFDYQASAHRSGSVENGSPDGSVLGNATRPGYELLDTHMLKPKPLTTTPLADSSVSDEGVITDNVHWIRDYPKDLSFVTYYDATGEHLLYHGKCGGRPQFLTNDLILEPGCKNPLIIDIHGNLVRTLPMKGSFSYAGVSQNGKLFALQVGDHTLKHEHFVIYSVETGEAITEVAPDQPSDGQSWSAFSPDGLMFVIGSPLKLTLYRLP
jgi:hypothetical protein